MVRKIVLTIFFIAAQLAVIFLCRAHMLASSNPAASLRYVPNYSPALMQLNAQLSEESQRLKNHGEIKSNALAAIGRAPLDHKAFYYLGLSDFWSTNEWSERDIMEQAKRLRPRHQGIVQTLLRMDLTSVDMVSGSKNIDLLLRIDTANETIYFDLLLAFMKDPQGFENVAGYLKDGVPWGQDFILHSLAAAQTEDVLKLGPVVRQRLSVDAASDDSLLLESRYLRTLTRLGFLEQAYAFWQESEGRDASPYPGLHDPLFSGTRAAEPFNWSQRKSKYSIVELSPYDGLYVSYNGGTSRKILYQIIPVQTGVDLTLSAEGRWDYTQRTGIFEWRAICTATGNVLASLPLDNAAKRARSMSVDIAMDPDMDCGFIDLQLWAVPGPDMTRISAAMKSADLSKKAL